MERERLFQLAMLLAQLAQAEAADDVPRAFDFRYHPPHSPRCSLLIGSRGEDRPSDVEPRGPLEVGATSAKRLPSAHVAVVRGAHVVP